MWQTDQDYNILFLFLKVIFLFLKDFIYLFLGREGKEKER